MALTAKDLSKAGARGRDIDAQVQEQIQLIDQKLQRADRAWGRNVVHHDLPTTIPLPGLDKKDGQRLVYSAVILSLEKRGFEVALVLDTDRTTIAVAWATEIEPAEVEAMNTLIRERRLGRQELAEFGRRGRSMAPKAPPREAPREAPGATKEPSEAG